MRRSHLVLAGILVAVVALCVSLWVNKGPLWRLVMLKTRHQESSFKGLATRVELTINRWTGDPYGKYVSYYVNTGFICWMQYRRDGQIRMTYYNKVDGTVMLQVHATIGAEWVNSVGETLEPRHPWLWGIRDQSEPTGWWISRDSNTSPPWWWGVKDQTKPTAPWLNEKQ